MKLLTALEQRTLLERLVVDNRDLETLESLLEEFNIFEAVGSVRQELRHSDFLRFLLDPSENHGLGSYFLKAFLKRCLVGSAGSNLSSIDVDVADLNDAVVDRERWNIDVLIHSERARVVLAIENKVDSGEHTNQLNRYVDIIDTQFPGHRKAFVFLTPEGDIPSDPERWLPMSYVALAQVVRAVRQGRGAGLANAVAVALQHYETLIGRHIVSESEIARLCQQLYKQHKDALDLIFEHIPDLQTQTRAELEDEIRSHSEYLLDHCTKSAVRFYHKSWEAAPLQHNGSGWTPTKRVVLFEISNGPDFVRLKLVIGPVDRNDSAATAFREAAFRQTRAHTECFPGGMSTLAPRYTTVLSKELVKKRSYSDPQAVPNLARQALRAAFTDEIKKAVSRLEHVMSEPTLSHVSDPEIA